MSEITASKYIPIKDLMKNIELYRYNPSNIQRVILDHLEAVTEGKVDIVDPTNPFVFLLESSSIGVASHFMESEVNLRKQYPALAQSVSDLFLHMSDKDFANLFATPATTKFTFMIQMQSMLSQMVESFTENCKKITIPRNTEITIDSTRFSLQYPIDIRLFKNNVIQVSYDGSQKSPLQNLTTNIIPFKQKRDASNVEWLYFTVEMSQFFISSTYFAAQASRIFSEDIAFTDSYYYARVFVKKDTSTAWTEIATTLTDQVYDPYTPTAVLRPDNEKQILNVFIPPVYITNGTVDGSIRVDIYQTKGKMNLDTSNFNIDAFSTKLIAVDQDTDITPFTNAMNNVSYFAYSAEFITGGTAALDFETLRASVINNSIGNFNTPITNVQLLSDAEKNGFKIVRNVDVVTNRILLATQNLPAPTNDNLITAANATIKTLITDMDALSRMDTVVNNGKRMTVLSKSLFINENGRVKLQTQSVIDGIRNMAPNNLCSEINKGNYLYSPFYYVLDNSRDEFETRAYHLDNPRTGNLSFISQNSTAELRVNTSSCGIEKTDFGYRLAVEVSSDDFYKNLPDTYIQAQLYYVPDGEVSYAYLPGRIAGKNLITGERIFIFDIKTNFDVNDADSIVLTNFEMFANEFTLTASSLKNKFNILYTTTSIPINFVPDTANTEVPRFMVSSNAVAITKESLDITFGHALGNLWTRSRSVAAGRDYKRYTEDVPAVYERNVYKTDPVTGATVSFDADGKPVIQILHQKGEIVKNDDGEIVYKHRKGDVIFDENGKPIYASDLFTERHIDMLFVDGAYFFATDSSHVTYRKELANVISTWVTESLSDIQKELLEKTEIYFYPTSSIGLVSVYLDQNTKTTIEAKQSLSLVLYVSESVYNDGRIRKQLTTTAIKTLNDALKKTTVSISDMIDDLKTAFGSTVISFNVNGLGGKANYDTITLVNNNETLSLNKVLAPQDDGTLIVIEDVSVSFINYTK